MQTGQGTDKWIRAIGRPYFIDGKIAGFKGSYQDISEQKKTEIERLNRQEEVRKSRDEAIRANNAKNQFIANMSREIRTPMNGIVAMVDILLEKEMNLEQRNIAQTIQKSSEALLLILNDILDFSKIEANKLEISNSVFDLNKCIEGVINLFIAEAEKKNIALESNINEQIPAFIECDELRLRQVLSNLIGNAIKFTLDGGVQLTVTTDNKKEFIIFKVSDTGIGIPDSKQKLLFKPFSQIDSSNTRNFGGTGLGLAISQSIGEKLKGDISFTSKENKGSSFVFRLPYTERQLLRKNDSPNLLMERKKSLSHLNILVADDNALNRKIVGHFLIKLGVSFTIVENGLEAIVEFRKAHYDLILMDIQMPVLDGISATKKIFEVNLKSPPSIIAMTANVLEKDLEQYIKVGIKDVISKPFRLSQFEQTIRKYSDFIEDKNLCSDSKVSNF
ncbi:MAG: ATP-binding protein [Oligoflexales bacterium]